MEEMPRNEGAPQQESLVARKRKEAFASVLEALDTRITSEPRAQFESYGKEYPITSREDMMVAYAQQLREETETYYSEIVSQNAYREEQALVKILRLFEAYEKLAVLYAELLSYYPDAAARIEKHLPPLSDIAVYSNKQWEKVQKDT